MTDTELLRKVIEKSGYKIIHIAHSIGLSGQGFYNKINGKSEFNVKEITKFCKLLNISSELRDKIFFGKKVDEMSTY